MNWQRLDQDLYNSFQKDFTCMGWADTGRSVICRRSQEWDKGRDRFFVAQYDSAKDIYLDHPFIAEEWQKVYGTPKLKDFVEPVSRQELEGHVVSVSGLKPWRVYGGKPECQYIYGKHLEILDVCMRHVCGQYPRGVNNRFVLGDAGCWGGGHCSGHGGAHDSQEVIDLNYCTHYGMNMTQYRRNGMPVEYHYTDIPLWWDDFPYRELRTETFDTEKNYALYKLLAEIFVGNSRSFRTSIGLNNHFKKTYGSSVLQGDDVEYYNHDRHVHLFMDRSVINYEVEL